MCAASASASANFVNWRTGKYRSIGPGSEFYRSRNLNSARLASDAPPFRIRTFGNKLFKRYTYPVMCWNNRVLAAYGGRQLVLFYSRKKWVKLGQTDGIDFNWSDVDAALLDTELDEHLVQLPNGRFGWRVSMPAMMSYWSELARDGVACEQRWLAGDAQPAPAWLTQQLAATRGPVIAATDYVRAVPETVRAFIPEGRKYITLGTDGFGRSDTRAALRQFFGVDAASVAQAARRALAAG